LNRLPWRLDDNRRARRFGSFHFEIIEGQIGFLDIAAMVERTLEKMPRVSLDSLADVYNLDKAARELATELVVARARTSG